MTDAQISYRHGRARPGHPRLHFACGLHKKDVDARHRRQVYAVCAIQTAMAGHDEEGVAVTPPKAYDKIDVTEVRHGN